VCVNPTLTACHIGRYISVCQLREVGVIMVTGKVDFFHDRKGYGFIASDEADDDVFFHMEDVGGPDLEEGQEVEFDIESSPKGPRAANVQRL